MRKDKRINMINFKIESEKKVKKIADKYKITDDMPEEEKERIIKERNLAYTLNFNKMKDLIEVGNNLTEINSTSTKKDMEKVKRIEDAKEYYGNLRPFFEFTHDIKNHLKKKQTGNELIKNAQEVNLNTVKYMNSKPSSMLNSSMATIYEAWDFVKNIKDASQLPKDVAGKNRIIVFDTETFSGMDEYGKNTFSALQEMTFNVYRKNAKGELEKVENESLNTVLGIDNKLYDKYKKIFIDDFKEKGFNGRQENQVIYERLAKLGHKDTEYNMSRQVEGIVSITKFAGDDAEDLFNPENIQRGLDKLLEIGSIQEKAIGSNGLKTVDNEFFRMATMLNDSSNAVLSYNGIRFDTNKLNIELANKWQGLNSSQKREIAKAMGMNRKDTPFIETYGRQLDFYEVVKAFSSENGKEKLYDYGFKDIKSVVKSGKGLMTQESLVEGILKGTKDKGMAAHTSAADVENLTRLFFEKNIKGMTSLVDQDIENETYLEYLINGIKGKQNDEEALKLSKDLVFVADRPMGYFGSTSRDLNFIKDNQGNFIINSGFALDSNDEVRELGKYKGKIGMPKNTTFSIDNVSKITLTEDGLKALNKYDQENAQNSLFAITLKPVMPNGVSEKEIKDKTSVLIFNSLEEVEGMLSSNATLIGIKNKNGVKDLSGEAGDKIRKKYEEVTIKDGVRSYSETSAQKIVDNSSYYWSADSAARSMRDISISKAEKYLDVVKMLEDKGIYGVKKQKETIDTLMIAKNISNNKVLDLETQLRQRLQHQDFNTGNQVLSNGMLSNFVNSYEHMDSNRILIEEILSQIKDMPKNQQERAFEYIFDASRKNIADMLYESETAKDKALSFIEDRPVYAKDLNLLEIDIPEGLFKNTKSKSLNEPIDKLTINLESSPKSFSKTLVRNIFGDRIADLPPEQYEAYAKEANMRFIKAINKSEKYKGIFDPLLKEKNTFIPKNIYNEIGELYVKKGAIKEEGIKDKIRERIYSAVFNEDDPRHEKYIKATDAVSNLIDKVLNKKNEIAKMKEEKNNKIKNVNESIKELNEQLKEFFFPSKWDSLTEEEQVEELKKRDEYLQNIKTLTEEKNKKVSKAREELKALKDKKTDTLKTINDTISNLTQEIDDLSIPQSEWQTLTKKERNAIKKKQKEKKEELKNVRNRKTNIISDINKDIQKAKDNKKNIETDYKSRIRTFQNKVDSLYGENKEWKGLPKSERDRIISEQQWRIEAISDLKDQRQEIIDFYKDPIDNAYTIKDELRAKLTDAKKAVHEIDKEISKEVHGEKTKRIDEVEDKINKLTKVRNEFKNKKIKEKDFNNISSEIISENIQNVLKEIKNYDPLYGIESTKGSATTDAVNINKIASTEEEARKIISEIVSRNKENVPKEMSINAFSNLDTDKKRIARTAEELVDSVFMPKLKKENGKVTSDIEEIVKYAAKKNGFSEQSKKVFADNLYSQKEAYESFAEKLIKSVTKHGGQILYDENTRDILMAFGNDVRSLNHLPKTMFDNGVMEIQSGNTRYAAEMFFNVTDAINGKELNKNKVRVQSKIAKAFRKSEYLELGTDRAYNKGNNVADYIMSIISEVTSVVREMPASAGPSIKYLDDFKKIDFKEMYENLPMILNEIGQYNNWNDKDFFEIIKKYKNQLEKGDIGYEVKEAVTKNLQDLYKIYTGIGAGNNPGQRELDAIYSRSVAFLPPNQVDEFKRIATDQASVDVTGYNKASRPPLTALDEHIFRKKDVEKWLSDTKKNPYLKDNFRIGATTVSQRSLTEKTVEGIGEVVDEFTIRNLSMSEKNVKSKMYDTIDKHLQNTTNEKTRSMLENYKKVVSGWNLEEQEALMSGDLSLAMFSKSRNQYITLFKDFDMAALMNDARTKERLMNVQYKLEISKMGEINFELGKKEYVKRGDPLLIINEYGNTESVISSKNKLGKFSLGVYGKGTNIEISKEDINKYLTENKDRILEFDKESGKYVIREDKALKALNEKFDIKYAVEDAFSVGYNKGTFGHAEKGMFRTTAVGAGVLNEENRKILDKIYNKTGFDFRGEILTDDTIKDISNMYDKYMPFGFKNGKTNGELFANELKKERDFGTKLFKETFGGAQTIANMGELKHQNAGLTLENMINAAVERNMLIPNNNGKKRTWNEALQKTVKDIDDYNILEGSKLSVKNDKILWEDVGNPIDKRIDVDNAKKFMKDYKLYEKWDGPINNPNLMLDDNGNIIGIKNMEAFSANKDFAGQSKSDIELEGLKRELSGLKEQRSKQYELAPEDRDYNTIGILNSRINEVENDINGRIGNNKKMKIASRERDMLSLYEYNDQNVNTMRQILGDEDFKKYYGDIVDDNLILKKEYKNTAIQQPILDMIDSKSREKIGQEIPYINSHINAMKVNGLKGYDQAERFSIIDAEKAKEERLRSFKIINIKDLNIPTGESNSFLEKDPNRSFGQEYILDTGLEGSNKYVSIPLANYSVNGENINKNETQKSLSKLQNAISDIEKFKIGDNQMSENTSMDQLVDRANSLVDDLKKSIINDTRATLKDVKKVEVDGYAYEKAGMAMYFGNGNKFNYYMFDEAMFGDKKLSEWADKGVFLDSSFHGKQYFENLGLFNKEYLKKYNMTEEQMEDHLMHYGTIGLESRTPTIKEGSILPVLQFYDPTLQGNMTKTSAITAIARNQDQDGDSILQAALKLLSENGGDTAYIDYALSKERGIEVDEKVQQAYNMLERSMMHRGGTVNRNANEYMKEEYKEVLKGIPKEGKGELLDNARPDKVLEKSLLAKNKVVPYLSQEIDTELANNYKSLYGEIEEGLKKQIGEVEYKKMDQLQRVKEIDKYITNNNLSEKYLNAAKFTEISLLQHGAEMSIVAGKASIGNTNVPFARIRRLAYANGLSNDDRQNFQAMADVLEQNIISKKNNVDTALSLASTFEEGINKIISKDMSGLKDINSLIDSFGKDIANKARYFGDRDLLKTSNEDIINNVKGTVREIAKKFRTGEITRNQYLAEDIESFANPENISTLIKNIDPDSTGMNHVLAEFTNKDGVKKTPKISMKGYERNVENEAKEALFKATEEIGKASKKISSGTLAKGALGIAAAIMMTGYIGGNPSIAPGDEANTAEQNNQYQDEGMVVQQAPQGTGNGYVININAESPKGKDHAMQAIQKAISSSMPTDVNISMNVEDKTKIMDQRYLNQLLERAL